LIYGHGPPDKAQSPVRIELAVSALAARMVVGVAGERFLGGDVERAPTLRGEGTLRDLPDGPVHVRAETTGP